MRSKIVFSLLVIFSLFIQCDDTINSDGHKVPLGLWRFVDNPVFNYLVLFTDNTFLYAEGGGVIESPEEDGLELGDYTYNQDNGTISFNLNYDDNDPGNDSGVGDIGTPVTHTAILSDNDQTLSLAGGELILTFVDTLSTIPIHGVWRKTSDPVYQCLILFEDNTFLYAEKGGVVESPEEDGLELGTYTYNSSNSTITFNLTYDDNDPGNDSGVGDIGKPVTYSVALSDINRTLTIEGLVLTKEY